MNSSLNRYISIFYLKDRKYILWIICFLLGVSSYLGFVTPLYIKDFYQAVENENFFIVAKQLSVIFIITYFNRAFYQLATNKYLQYLLLRVRGDSYSRWIKTKDFKLGKDYPLGEIISRILNDTNAVTELISSGAFTIIIDIFYVISCLVSFIWINTKTGALMIALELIFCFLLLKLTKQLSAVFLRVRKYSAMLSRSLADLTKGIKDLSYYPHHHYGQKLVRPSFEKFLAEQLKANVWDAGVYSLSESLFPLLLAVLVWFLPYSSIVEVAVLASIIDLLQRSIAPIKSIASKIAGIQRANAGLTRVHEFMDKLDPVDLDGGSVIRPYLNINELKIEIPHFEYENDKQGFSLENIQIEAKSGELIGLIGTSGSGKSTIFKILAGHLKTEKYKFETKLSNEDEFRSLSMEEFTTQVSLVSQDAHIFSDSYEFNITLGDSQDFDSFWSELIEKFEYLRDWNINPLDTIDVKTISMGQRQLITALRSMYLKKPIVLFDEISAGLDPDLEKILRELVLKSREQSITFLVAHRVETVIEANKIFLLNKGKVEQSGTHSDLLKLNSNYRDLFYFDSYTDM